MKQTSAVSSSLPLLLPSSGALASPTQAKAHFQNEVSQTASPAKTQNHQLPAAVCCLTPVQKHMKLPGKWDQGIGCAKKKKSQKNKYSDKSIPSLVRSAAGSTEV